MLSGGLRTKGIIKYSQENMPLITVVTVVRNGEKTLEETILSVINQTYKNVEYIIVDGASTDGTLDIIKKYEDKIDYWISEPDDGIYDAMNKGIDLATGEYIAMLNSDDWYEHDACETVVKKIKEVKADVYYGMMRVIDKQNNKFIYVYAYTDQILYQYMIAHPTCFIKKVIYNLYRYDIKYKSAADYDFMIRLKKTNCKFIFFEHIIANFRSGGMSCSVKGQIETIEIKKKHGLILRHEFLISKILIQLRNIYIQIRKNIL